MTVFIISDLIFYILFFLQFNKEEVYIMVLTNIMSHHQPWHDIIDPGHEMEQLYDIFVTSWID